MGVRSDDSVHGAGGDRPSRYASVADRLNQAFLRGLAACLRRHNVLEYLVDNVGATGFDGALAGLKLREEVVGHLSKLPAHLKCRLRHVVGCLTSGHVLRGSSVGLERTPIHGLVGQVDRVRG